MYHNQIQPQDRQKYLDLLTKAEQLLPTLLLHQEHLPIILKAASAVRGSAEVITRIRRPITPAHIVTLKKILIQSRNYTTNFWPKPEPATVPHVAAPQQPSTLNSKPSTLNSKPSTLNPPPSSVPSGSTDVQSVAVAQQPPAPNSHLSPLNSNDSLRQYLHTLSPKLQAQAAILPSKYSELNETHELLDRLVRSILAKGQVKPTQNGSPALTAANSREISHFSQKIDSLTHTIDAFWNRVHAERQTLAGTPVTKEYQTVLDDEEKKYPMEEAKRTWGDYSKSEIDKMMTDPSLLPMSDAGTPVPVAQIIATRQNRDKCLLRRPIPQRVTEQTKQERILAMQELHDWGIFIEKKQQEMLQQLGIEVPKNWLNPQLTMTEEEKAERRRAKDRQRKRDQAPLDQKLHIGRKIRSAKSADNPYLQTPTPNS